MSNDPKTHLLALMDEFEATYNRFVSQLTPEERALEGKPQDWYWAPKDALNHVVYWTERYISDIKDNLAGRTPPTDGDDANDIAFEERRAYSWDDTAAAIQRSFADFRELINTFEPDDLMNKEKFAWTNGRPLFHSIIGTVFTHAITHFSDVYAHQDNIPKAAAYFQQGIEFFQKENLDVQRGYCLYNLACLYGKKGFADEAIQLLPTAFQLVPNLMEYSKTDVDFDPIRHLEAFQAVYANLEPQPAP